MQNLPTETKQAIPTYYEGKDEISLIDLWLVFSRHKKIIIYVTCVFALLSVFFALMQNKVYGYSSTIEIGSITSFTPQGVRTVLIDEPQTVLEKLNNAYIPNVINKYISENVDVKLTTKNVQAFSPEKSNLIIIKAKCEKEKEEICLSIINYVVDELKKDHAKLYNIMHAKMNLELEQESLVLKSLDNPNTLRVRKSGLENDIKTQENKLKTIDETLSSLAQKKNQLEELGVLLRKEINKLNGDIGKATEHKSDALKSIHDETRAMTLLMIDNEIRNYRTRLFELEERLNVKLENDRVDIENQISENKRLVAIQNKSISDAKNRLVKFLLDYDNEKAGYKSKMLEIETRMNNMKQTRALVPAYRSLVPIGTSRKSIVLLGSFMGFICSILMVIIVEFSRKVREAEKQMVS